MTDYKVSGSDLTSVASAIRTKGGTSAALSFPTGFVTAIGAIPSGGSATLITKNITANGTYNASSDNADGYSSVTVAVPSKLVAGTFTGQTTDKGSAISVSIPYTGSGYPVAGIIYATAGAFKSGGDIATLAKQYAFFFCSFAKVDTSATPTYSGNAEANWAELMVEYKNSNSDATSTNYNRGHLQQFYYNSAARATAQAAVRFRGNTSMSVFIADTSYGFPDNIEFTYQIIYSS